MDYKFCNIGGGATANPNAWYYSNDEETYGIDGTKKCGLLYNWPAAKYLEDNKATLLPTGWHVPTRTEVFTLLNKVGGLNGTGGKTLKAIDGSVIEDTWPSDWNGTDEHGFGMLPGGRYYNGAFQDGGTKAYIWTITDSDTNAHDFEFTSAAKMSTSLWPKYMACSLRLVKDV